MINEKKIRIAKIHICSFENYNANILKYNLEKYPERICVIDEQKDIVVDVETRHQYPYIRTVNMSYFLNDSEKKKVIPGKRVGCFEYYSLSLFELSSDDLKKCNKIINLLKENYIFPEGNDELTNEQYLELINSSKKEKESKKKYKKRK